MLELWKANEEKQAALVALKQSEEALHQVWRQVRPPGVGPLITVPSAAPIPEEAHRDPAGGCGKAKCRSRSERARARDAASLVARGPMRASGSREEPLTRKGTSRPGVQAGSLCGQGAPAEGNPEARMKQERRGPVSPTEPAEEEQPPTGAPWLIKTIKQEQPGPASCPGPAGLEWPQVGGPRWPRPVKTEEP